MAVQPGYKPRYPNQLVAMVDDEDDAYVRERATALGWSIADVLRDMITRARADIEREERREERRAGAV